MSRAGETMDDIGAEVRREARQAAGRFARGARDAAETAADEVRGGARRGGQRMLGGLAAEIADLARALDAAGAELRPGSPQQSVADGLSRRLDRTAERIEGRPVDRLVEDAGRFAASSPLLFLGGAALAGFAASRIARLAAERPEDGGPLGATGSGATGPDAADPPASPDDLPGGAQPYAPPYAPEDEP
ncbi:hypothetical protein [Frigidibacter sp. MR17.24]|uniref:hypothetical protein n=1 Tax=Frigidibacter sp. MR17.24 TaxID=3127345 RepID=UPI003012BA47